MPRAPGLWSGSLSVLSTALGPGVGWGSAFLPLSLSDSQPRRPRGQPSEQLMCLAGCAAFAGSSVLACRRGAASCPCRHAHYKGVCLAACTASPSQGSRRLSASEEAEAWGGGAASSGPECRWGGGRWRVTLPCFSALLPRVLPPCLPGCLVPGAPGRWPPGPVDSWGQSGLGAQAGLCGLCGWGPSSPLLLTGCCRTTGWEGSPRRRCGSCQACSLCELGSGLGASAWA